MQHFLGVNPITVGVTLRNPFSGLKSFSVAGFYFIFIFIAELRELTVAVFNICSPDVIVTLDVLLLFQGALGLFFFLSWL